MFDYTLRLQLPPTLDFEERIANALDFCEKAKIDEVMFFVGCEELNTGHITIEEAKPYVETIKRASKILKERGIKISLNPWMTIGHYDGGKTLKKGQDFGTLVGDDGETASMQACPLSENWRKYYVELLNFYVDNLSPDVIWLEDDFRMESHRAKKVIVQGCFCDEHMKLYNSKLGTNYNRETFVKLLATDLKVRKAYLDGTRETMEGALKYVADNVKGQKRFGLMTGGTCFIEGRRYGESLEVLKSGDREKPLNRLSPLVARQASPQLTGLLLNKQTMLARALTGDKADCVTEMENNPHTMYTKSANFCKFQMLSALPLALTGATFSIFEFNGNGAVNYDRLASMYSKIKPYLSAVEELKLLPTQMKGVNVLVNQDVAYSAKINSNSFIRGYSDQSGFIFAILELLGVACVYTDNAEISGCTIAVSGQVLRSYDDMTVENLFKNNRVILTAESVEALFDKGLSHLIGAKGYARMECRQTPVTMEQIRGEEKIFGITKMRATLNFGAGDYINVKYVEPSAEVLTDVLGNDQTVVGDGITAVNNALILPYYEGDAQPFALFNPLRELLIKRFIENGANDGGLAFVEQENVAPYIFDKGDYRVIMLVNYCDDDYPEITLKTGKEYADIKLITVDNPEGYKPDYACKSGVYTIKETLKGCESAVVIFKE